MTPVYADFTWFTGPVRIVSMLAGVVLGGAIIGGVCVDAIDSALNPSSVDAMTAQQQARLSPPIRTFAAPPPPPPPVTAPQAETDSPAAVAASAVTPAAVEASAPTILPTLQVTPPVMDKRHTAQSRQATYGATINGRRVYDYYGGGQQSGDHGQMRGPRSRTELRRQPVDDSDQDAVAPSPRAQPLRGSRGRSDRSGSNGDID